MGGNLQEFKPFVPVKPLPLDEIYDKERETAKRLHERALTQEQGNILRNPEVITPEQFIHLGGKDALVDFASVLSGEMELTDAPQDIYCPDTFANSMVTMAEHSGLYDQETEQVVATDGEGIYILNEPLRNGTYSCINRYYSSGPVMEMPEGFKMQAIVHSHPPGVLDMQENNYKPETTIETLARGSDNFSPQDVLALLTEGSDEDFEQANASILVGTTHVNMLVRTKNTPKRILDDNSRESYEESKKLATEIREILRIDLDKAVHPQNLANLVRLRDKYGLAVYRMDLRKAGLNVWKKI